MPSYHSRPAPASVFAQKSQKVRLFLCFSAKTTNFRTVLKILSALDKFRQNIHETVCMIGLCPQDIVGYRKDDQFMPNVSKEYLLLFNAITDAEEALCQLRQRLMSVQQRAEEIFLEESDSADSDPL